MPPFALVDRAIRYLSEHGKATPAELARHVFGGETLVALLTTLRDDRLLCDGQHWSLRPATDEWALLEILTTGPNPSRHRIVEVAAFRDGHRFHALVAGDKAVPKLLRNLGVPSQPNVEAGLVLALEWRPLDVVAAELRTFLGSASVAGFSYQPAFLDQLLGPAWPAIDLLQLLYKVSYFAGRPDPASLARHFGLAAPVNRRPQAMLGFSARLFERLRGDRSLAELRQIAAPRMAERPSIPELPAEPGVYVMSAPSGEALYVGKSVNLNQRVGSYLGRPIAESRGLYHLTDMTSRIDVIPVETELEALLLESKLIAEWQPAFNVQRQSGARCCYLRLSMDEAFPRLAACIAPAPDGATYFGPFRHPTAALRLRTLLATVLRLRTCTRQLPPRRKPRLACSKVATGACLAPCVPGPPPEPYSREVALARELLRATPEGFRRILLRLLQERPPAPAKARRIKRLVQALAEPLSATGHNGNDDEAVGGGVLKAVKATGW